jgi:hypothetical protein
MLQGETERELQADEREDEQADELSKISLSPSTYFMLLPYQPVPPAEKHWEPGTEADEEGKIGFNTFNPSFSTSPFFTLPT